MADIPEQLAQYDVRGSKTAQIGTDPQGDPITITYYVVLDDHCYVAMHVDSEGTVYKLQWLPAPVVELLKELPLPT